MEKQVAKLTERTITDSVLAKITSFQSNGTLVLPKDYSPENALKSAYLLLVETVDKDKRPVLESCTKESIANALLDMVVQGLNPVKKQCYFIPYGNKLSISRSYQGTVAMAKRVGLKSIVANVIYDKDQFAYEIDKETGLKRIVTHVQDFTNIDIEAIKGAYAIVTMDDGTKTVEIMNIIQIKRAWMQGAAKGNSGAHTGFTDEMAKKTVIARACKSIINSSDDSYLFSDEENEVQVNRIPEANTVEIGIDHDNDQEVQEEVQTVQTFEEKTETVQEEKLQNTPGF